MTHKTYLSTYYNTNTQNNQKTNNLNTCCLYFAIILFR